MMSGNALQPQVRPIADLTPENLRALLLDMGSGPGWYASAALYRWYVGMAQEEKLEPVSQRAFGGTLRALGYRSATRRVGGKNTRCWFLPKSALR
jgi:hypothetical protein